MLRFLGRIGHGWLECRCAKTSHWAGGVDCAFNWSICCSNNCTFLCCEFFAIRFQKRACTARLRWFMIAPIPRNKATTSVSHKMSRIENRNFMSTSRFLGWLLKNGSANGDCGLREETLVPFGAILIYLRIVAGANRDCRNSPVT